MAAKAKGKNGVLLMGLAYKKLYASQMMSLQCISWAFEIRPGGEGLFRRVYRLQLNQDQKSGGLNFCVFFQYFEASHCWKWAKDLKPAAFF